MNILFYCQKRDGSIVPFDKKYITSAIHAAFKNSHEGNQYVARKVTESVCDILIRKYQDKVPSVEDIQDVVEEQLIYFHFIETARKYILYRNQHKELRKTQEKIFF
ncbi:hypothetical protein bcgnr5378_29280 [Bacillus cereus]|uniref:Anaerobic ribonucleoside-triphosphate reductase n=1 Tax=Bacillus cereus TaxID=1396 RepID=A0A164NCH3_BACCE|nr:ATP cone domain-containing protein [Bacillus cereus]KZD63348.1 anaerobic ribonucleoside-triphosphate reductase [Bacillus cereus]GCF70791.1 hypothetical protein BC2903_46100 [Bacillus cereus]HDR8321386.1 hypothetical protein [Bacillus cereus]HDR8329578.1 hypothetical protein [Bacillus cereus]HDR8332907.1 hypothetical protein [Bacillus cereus]